MVYFFSFLSLVFVQKQRLQGFHNQLGTLTAEMDELKNLDDTKSRGNRPAKTPNPVLDNIIPWASFLNEVSQKTPSSVQLKKMDAALMDDRRVVLEGAAVNLQSVSRFKRNLESSPMCDRVVLLSSEQAEASQGAKRLNFQMEYWIQ